MPKTHTPAPLFAHRDPTGVAWHVSNRQDDDDTHPDYKRTARTTDSENAEQDANLYAAAPDLLKACRWLKTLEEWENAHPDLEFVSLTLEDELIEVWPEFRTINGRLKFCDAMNRVRRKRDEAITRAEGGVA